MIRVAVVTVSYSFKLNLILVTHNFLYYTKLNISKNIQTYIYHIKYTISINIYYKAQHQQLQVYRYEIMILKLNLILLIVKKFLKDWMCLNKY